MCSRVVRLLLWNAMVHERVYAFSWPEMQRMFKRMQSLVQNNENTDQREGENMGEKEGEMVKQTGVNQQNSGPEVYYPIRGRGNAAASPDDVRGVQDVQQQNVQQQSQFDITADKRESFTEKKLVANLEKAERLPGRKRSDNGGNEKNDGDGNSCGGAGAQQTDRRTPGLRATRNDCCDTKAKQQSRNVNEKLSEAEQASKRLKPGDIGKIWLLLVISLALTFAGICLYSKASLQPVSKESSELSAYRNGIPLSADQLSAYRNGIPLSAYRNGIPLSADQHHMHHMPSVDAIVGISKEPPALDCTGTVECEGSCLCGSGCVFGIFGCAILTNVSGILFSGNTKDPAVGNSIPDQLQRSRCLFVDCLLVNDVVIGAAGMSALGWFNSCGDCCRQDNGVEECYKSFLAYHCVSLLFHTFFFGVTCDWIPHRGTWSWPRVIESGGDRHEEGEAGVW